MIERGNISETLLRESRVLETPMLQDDSRPLPRLGAATRLDPISFGNDTPYILRTGDCAEERLPQETSAHKRPGTCASC